ncbi:MAG: RadC family protein [Verrucomicrobiota bacterium]
MLALREGREVPSFQGPSNEELLASLAGKPAAAHLMGRFGGLTNLSQASFDDLRQVPGVGPSKAAAIRSAFLLAQRLAREAYPESPILDAPDRVAGLLREECRPLVVEKLFVLCLNTRRRLISSNCIAEGIIDSVLVHPREVFALAISRRASAVILVHNHPSGDPTPSEADIRMTRQLTEVGRIIKIEVLDHIIVGHRTPERPRDYASLRELGYV